MENPVLTFLDCCVSDYFRGHSNQVIAVFPTSKTTIGELIRMVKDEAESFEMNEEHDGYSWNDFNTAMKIFEKDNSHQLNEIAFDDIEDDDDLESVVAYFVVVEG